MNSASTPHEIETALFVCAPEPQRICEQIAQLQELAGYRLVPQAPKAIHDWYLDTPTHILRSKRLGLRVRQSDTQLLLTLKGEAQMTDWGGVRRLEREQPWSRASFTELLSVLREAGVDVNPALATPSDPRAALRQVGLQVIQDRETHRQIRNIVATHRDELLAELAIDALTYHFASGPVRCYEVEIEEKQGQQSALLQQLVEALMRQNASSLRRWPHGKLATGLALEQLLRVEARRKLVDARDQLKPEACELLAERLKAVELY